MINPVYALIAWIPIGAMLMSVRQPAYGIALCYVAGWLLLPVAGIEIQGLPNIDKLVVVNLAAAAGILMFHTRRLNLPRLRIPDVLFLAFLTSTLLTSLSNELGLKDGVSTALTQMWRYGVPYFIGRIFFRTRADLETAARVVVAGAAVYAVFAVWEWRMSPQLNDWLYGFHQSHVRGMARWGFYRPIIFFQSTLATATFFAWVALLTLPALQRARTTGQLNLQSGLCALAIVGFLVTMSLGPYVLFATGCLAYFGWQRWKMHRLVWVMLAFGCVWMAGRYTGLTDGQWLIPPVASFAPQRADSLAYRIRAEDLLVDRAHGRPVLGWGGWGRNRATDERGRDLVATDGLWIIYAGSYGLAGLTLFMAWWCWPVIRAGTAGVLPALTGTERILLIVVGVQFVNFLFNAFLSPPLVLLVGGLTTMLYQRVPVPASRRRKHAYAMRRDTPAIPAPAGVQIHYGYCR